MEWAEWFQDVAGGVIKARTAAEYEQPYELQKMRYQALGEYGLFEPGKLSGAAPSGGIVLPSGLLLIAGAVVLVLALKG
jgi:hypothetical protein